MLARAPYAEHFRDWRPPWNYARREPTRERLLAAGFAAAECWLAPAPTQPEHPREFLATIVLGPHVQHLPEHLRDPFMDDVLAELGEPVVVDYVRLNIDATARPPAGASTRSRRNRPGQRGRRAGVRGRLILGDAARSSAA